jgi:hypothetical protein
LEAVTAKAADTETESQSANSPASDENTALSS